MKFKCIGMISLVATLFFVGGILLNDIYKPMTQIIEVSDDLRIIGNTAYMTMASRQMDFKDMNLFIEDIRYIEAVGIKKLHITMCSPGGITLVQWGMYDILKICIDNGMIVSTHINGYAASAAVFIFLLGDIRTMSDNSMLMIHAHSGTPGPHLPDSENTMLETWSKNMITIIANRTLMTEEEAGKHVGIGKNQVEDALWINAEQARYLGFTTK